MRDVIEARLSPVIFGRVMKQSGDHHVFGDREGGVPGFTHYQRCNPKKVCHVRNTGSLAPLDVDVTCTVDCACKPAAQVELGGLMAILFVSSVFITSPCKLARRDGADSRQKFHARWQGACASAGPGPRNPTGCPDHRRSQYFRVLSIREWNLLRIAIDTGGTFTDCVTLADGEVRVLKLFSTPGDPSRAVMEGLKRMGTGQVLQVRHGTTVGTNTMLERTGARVAFVTTAGFEDTIAIGRQTRTRLYDWFAPLPVCLVPKELRFGLRERVTAEGDILLSPSEEEMAALAEKVRASGAEAVAISLLFSFTNPETERRVEQAMLQLDLPVSASHRILPEFREYERASTTVVNAYLAPRIERYLDRLAQSVSAQDSGGRVDVMQSSGGIVPARVAAREPVRTVLSGPAGGVVGACQVARWAGFERIIGFDMGGTSTDVFLADAEGARLSRESVVAGVPIGVPMLDIHTAGAGGGSIARFDAGGMLRVGPESDRRRLQVHGLMDGRRPQ